MEMGERIKRLREDKDMSQEELGKLVGVQRAAVQKWESGHTKNLRQNTIKTLSDFFGVSPSYLMGMSEVKNTIPYEMKSVPLLGTVAGGEPIFVNEEKGVYIVTENKKADFCLRVKGDSMSGARIHDGDLVFVREQCEVENGEIAVVLVDNEATLKRFYKQDGVVVLKSENNNYQPIIYTEHDFKDVRILGKAIMFQSSL